MLPGYDADFAEAAAAAEEAAAEPLVSKDGVQAPAWYAQAKRAAEKKQAAEKLLWNGTAPSGTAGPLPLGPAGARFAPVREASQRTLAEAAVKQKRIAQTFFREFGVDLDEVLTSLPGAGAEEGAAAADGMAAADGASGVASAGGATLRSETTESALLRAEMLALGLSRSATSSQSGRRLRLLRELEAAVKELIAEGYTDRAVLGKYKAQIKESYANAPQEFIDEARKADMLNEALPPLTPAEIATEFGRLAEGLAGVAERAVATPDFDSLSPGRKRGPRELGNKVEINKPKPPE